MLTSPQPPQNILLRLQDALPDEILEAAILPMRPLQQRDILPAQYGRHDGQRIAVAQQAQVHEQPGYASVAVDEGMDEHEALVDLGRETDRVQGRSVVPHPLDKVGHLAGDLFRRGRRVAGAGDDHPLRS